MPPAPLPAPTTDEEAAPGSLATPHPDYSQVRLHVVTGKGGTGKTTVAAALALALAGQGRRVLLAEVEGRQGISQTFDVPPLPATETVVAGADHGGVVVGLAVDAKTALLEYLQLFYKLGRAGGVLERFGAIDFATTIAPGVRDVLLIGRVYEASRRRVDSKHHRGSRPEELAYDAIVLDAPPTGRIPRFLSVGGEIAGLAKMGPIRSQADSVTGLIHSPATCVHLVTLLEEMPVQETADAVGQLRSMGMRVGAVVINQARSGLLAEQLDDLDDLDDVDDSSSGPQSGTDGDPDDLDPATLAADLAAAGLSPTPELVAGLLEQVREHVERVELEDEQLHVLEDLGLPLVTVPYLVDGVDVDAICEIAELLAAQGLVQ